VAGDSPFGKKSRVQIIERHLKEGGVVTPETAWKFIYRELLWIDGSTGLAHLYESDKAQEGRPWFRRSVIFTERLCKEFGGITREELKAQIDRLFKACLEKLAAKLKKDEPDSEDEDLLAAIAQPEAASELPEEIVEAAKAEEPVYVPDADLVAEFAALIQKRLGESTATAEWLAREMVAKARFYFTVERKRQNVLGEGFEDLLQILMIRVSRVPPERIRVRIKADKLPGFTGVSTRERVESPDIVVIEDERTDLLTSVKWSLRHDRQKQLSDELDCYVSLLSQKGFPRYALITNEYDPGRLINTNGLNRLGQHVDAIYHINTSILLEAVSGHDKTDELERLIETRRIRSIEDFFKEMAQEYGADATVSRS
jgi:hypothetical protein